MFTAQDHGTGPMDTVTIRFLGTGDAFGSGGRLQTCIFVNTAETRFLIDCGTSSLIGMKRYGVDPSSIDVILLSHLHGDHFGGIPFIIRESQILAQRTAPLIIAGPAGLKIRIEEAMGVYFPGSSNIATGFPLEFIELPDNQDLSIDSLHVTAYPAIHTPATNPHSLRIRCNSRVIAYSGDTRWNDNLIEASSMADLFICEAFEYDKAMDNHIDYRTLMQNRWNLSCKRIVLTHMNDSVLRRKDSLELECAEDGMIITL
ncbi:MAG TPA: MBL fold metallo-hydrolase [Deltaproteobacteria bacterium]|nr:MBL fold metallo-hydrolase [Deltaproteobacteria bacterium]